ncbi:Lysosomal protective protein [Halotydeus destructor]|nr:Lysosomal protective protein [Halotydeus destructor]
MWKLVVACLVIGTSCVQSQSPEVISLPGLKTKPAFRHYSGYLKTASSNRLLHYWFVESSRSPQKDPLVLWLNGGPGCSSLAGLLTENGPFHIQPDGETVYMNNNSWNQVANVLYLESPAGVGFSYAIDGDVETNDDQVAEDSLAAIKDFFVSYPQFASNDFYITGESYGGIYVPMLSVQVLRNAPEINFKGYAIGNGALDFDMLGDGLILFGYFHGLYGKTLFNELIQECCEDGTSLTTGFGQSSKPSCSFVTSESAACQLVVSKVNAVISNNQLNVYNLYQDCAPTSASTSNGLSANSRTFSSREKFDRKLMSRQLRSPAGNELNDTPPCIDVSYVINYLRKPDVRQALHINSLSLPWDICSEDVGSKYQTLYRTMRPQMLELVNSGKLRGLVYNGDVDMACNFLGDEWFVDSLNLTLESDFQFWHYNGQIAGSVKHYKGLIYATVKGSGHMVPTDKAGPAFELFSRFLQ